jgi:gas vesicle structural protein
MPAASSTILDVLERVLDRGIVIDAWVGVSVAGIRLLEVDTRIVVASFETYLIRGQELAAAARPALELERASFPPTSESPASEPRASQRPPPARPAASPRRHRRRKVEPQAMLQLRCQTGCTFEWARAAQPPATMACPYRRRVRCRLVAA